MKKRKNIKQPINMDYESADYKCIYDIIWVMWDMNLIAQDIGWEVLDDICIQGL